MSMGYATRKLPVKRFLRGSAWGCDSVRAIIGDVDTPTRLTFIRDWRVYRGLTQAELAAAAGLTDATISRIETGKIKYTQDALEAIAQALAVDPGDLLTYSPAVAAPIWKVWEKAGPDERRQIEALAEAVVGWRKDRG